MFFSQKVGEVVRDSRRKKDIAQIAQIITNPCLVPQKKADNKEYDFVFLIQEITKRNIAYDENRLKNIIDPKTGTDNFSMYIYKIDEEENKCVVYANLESSLNKENLIYNKATPGGGIGVFKSRQEGWNGSPLYFQYSN